MKKIIFASIIIASFNSCTKQCFKCSIEKVDRNGQVIGTTNERYCIEKDSYQYQAIKNDPACKASI